MNSGPRRFALGAWPIASALIALIGACGSADDPAGEEVPAPPPHTERRAARTAAKADQFPYVATTELAALTARPAGERDFVLADARTRVEYDEQHIPGAVNAPADVAPAALDRMRVEHDRRVIFYCNGPNCTKSKKAAAAARRAGYANLFVYDEGLPAWLTAKLPVD